MSSTIQIRRGLETNRGAVTFAEGEILFTTDSPQALYIGDGSTSGGLELTNVRIPSAIKVDSSSDVGVGTSTPDAKLHIFRSDTTVTPDADADDFMIEGTGAIGMTIASTTTGIINFADAADSDIGAIEYSHTSNSLTFIVNAATAITIDSSQRVGIGVTPTAEDLEVGTGILIGTAAGTTNGTIRYTGTDFEGRVGGAWTSFTSGGGGGNTIYSADDSLSGNRTVTCGSSDLSFSSTTGTFQFGTGSAGLIDLFTITDDGTNTNQLLIYNTGDDAIIAMRGSTSSNSLSGITCVGNTIEIGGNGRQIRMISSTGGRLQVGGLTAKSSPEATLHVLQEDTGSSPVFGHFCVESTDATVAIEILGSITSTGGLYFGDAADGDIGRITYTHSSDEMHFYATNLESLRITSTSVSTDDNLVVNNLSLTAEAVLHVYNGETSVTPAAGADELFIEATGSSGMTIGSSTSGTGSINFGDSGDVDIGRIVYNHPSNYMAFYANAAERMRIDSSGNVVIGDTNAQAMLHVRTSNITGTPEADADELLLEGNGNTGMSIRSSASGLGSIHFGDSGDADIGKIEYSHSSNSLSLYANTTEIVRCVNGAFAIVDGITAPSTATGYAFIYVDSADGDLKVKFGDGTVATIAVDT